MAVQPSAPIALSYGKFTYGSSTLLQVQVDGNLDESGLTRLNLPTVTIGDQNVRIPAIGVGVLALPPGSPSVLGVKIDDKPVEDIDLEQVEAVGEVFVSETFVFPNGLRVEIYPQEGWGTQIPYKALSLAGYRIPDELARQPIGIATNLLTVYDMQRVIEFTDADGNAQSVIVKKVFSYLLAQYIADIINGRAVNDFADRLIPADIAAGTRRIFLTGDVLLDHGIYSSLANTGFLGALTEALGKEANDFEIVLSPGVSSWLIGAHTYMNARYPEIRNSHVLAIAVEKERLSYSDNPKRSTKNRDIPVEFKLNSVLMAEALNDGRVLTDDEKNASREILVDAIANLIKEQIEKIRRAKQKVESEGGKDSSREIGAIAIVVPGRVVEIGGKTVVISGSDIPNWSNLDLVDELRKKTGFVGKIVLVNDAVASAVYANSDYKAFGDTLVIGLHDGVGQCVTIDNTPLDILKKRLEVLRSRLYRDQLELDLAEYGKRGDFSIPSAASERILFLKVEIPKLKKTIAAMERKIGST